MSDNKKDKTIAGILAIFFGSFGIHHFYLGNGVMGLLHLCFCWFPVTWIVGIIDAVQLFSRSQQDFDRVYNKYSYLPRYEQKNFGNNINVADEILKLNTLFKAGIITFEEFERRKAKLLN